MVKRNKEKWTLPKNEVTWRSSGSTSTNRKKRSVASRAVDDRSLQLTLLHTTSGIEVYGEVEEGNYSKKQMQAERENLFSDLWDKLELKVARYLKLPGW